MGNPKGAEHPLWSRAGFNTPPAKWLRLIESRYARRAVADENAQELFLAAEI